MPSNNNLPAVEQAEVDLKIRQDEHQFQYAVKALEAQERDREAERKHNQCTQKTGCKFLAGFGFFLLILIIVAFFLNKETFLLEVVKYLFVGFGGGGVGYAVGFRRGRASNIE